jgi:hypothetical protein
MLRTRVTGEGFAHPCLLPPADFSPPFIEMSHRAPPPRPEKHRYKKSHIIRMAWKRDPATGNIRQNEEGREELRKLQLFGRNVADMFGENEEVEVVNLSLPAGPIRTNHEPSMASRRAGMTTPPRQVREDPFRNPFGGLGELPSEAGRTHRPPSIRRNRRTRRRLERRRRNTRKQRTVECQL